MATINIYILKCEQGKYYVGKSEDPQKRYQEHLNGKGSSWTRKYKPISLEKVYEKASPFDEDKYTKEYMAKYGIENVRGGLYTAIEISEDQEDTLRNEIRAAKDTCYKCGKAGHFANRCPKKTSFTASCGCGRTFMVFEEYLSHMRMCLPRRKEESSSEDEVIVCGDCNKEFTSDYAFDKHKCNPKQSARMTCYKCGREGHWANTCYAKRHINGKYINNY